MPSRWDDSLDYPQTFHTRTTQNRVPAFGADDADEDLADTDLHFIPGHQRARRHAPIPVRLLIKLAILPTVALLLVGVGAFGLGLGRDCSGKQSNQGCFTLSMFRSQAANQQYMASPTPTVAPALPAIPNDLPVNVHHFVTIALSYAVQAHQALAWPTSLILAMWGLEQGWSVPSYTGYNWGNVSAIQGEPSVGGINVPGSPAAFAYARTPADGLRYFLSAARLPYYMLVAPAAKQGGPDAAAVALGRSPWDANHYTVTGMPGSSLLAILHDFNFYRLDVGAGA